MPLDWAPLVDTIRRHQRLLLTTHVRPDGDGLGSQLALAEALRAQGKQVRLVIASKYPPRYDFLDPDRTIERFEPPGAAWRDTDMVLILDTGTWNQLGDFGPFLRELSCAKAVIDHHLTQDDLGAVRFVDTTAEATGRLAYELIRALGAPLSERAAQMLFVALAMDTGWYRHNNTAPETFELGAELMRAGARPDRLYEHLYEQSTLGRLKLIGVALDRLRLTDNGRIAHTAILSTDYEATGAVPQDTEDLVNYTLMIRGVEVGVLLMEQPRGGVKTSFRSRGPDVARVAEKFSGGGHRLASGAVIEAPLEEARARVLEALQAALDAAR